MPQHNAFIPLATRGQLLATVDGTKGQWRQVWEAAVTTASLNFKPTPLVPHNAWLQGILQRAQGRLTGSRLRELYVALYQRAMGGCARVFAPHVLLDLGCPSCM